MRYHRAPEVPTAWADEGEAPHYRGNLGFGLIEVRLCQVSRIWIGLYNLHMLSFRVRYFLNRPYRLNVQPFGFFAGVDGEG